MGDTGKGSAGASRWKASGGLSATRIGEPMRRDRLLLISAFATALLTLLGAVGESLGMDRLLKSNTSKTRTYSLFRQGCMRSLRPDPEHARTPALATDAQIQRSRINRWRVRRSILHGEIRGWMSRGTAIANPGAVRRVHAQLRYGWGREEATQGLVYCGNPDSSS
jgi:hypothetical protein